jgi:hypothetical protein
MEPAKYASVHDAYIDGGPEQFYREHGHAYRNPHEPAIAQLIGKTLAEWPLDFRHVLDLAAGSGEVTLSLQAAAPASSKQISAIDPYTAQAYIDRTGLPCERITFEEIEGGSLRGRNYSLIICSFAMHLVAESRLPALCWALAEVSPALMILTPHKRPLLKPQWRWRPTHEMIHERVRARLYTRESV